VLDVSFREDGSRIRKGNVPENFAVLRHISLDMIKKEFSLKRVLSPNVSGQDGITITC
jgi:predicted transposase YbfD/YdcC